MNKFYLVLILLGLLIGVNLIWGQTTNTDTAPTPSTNQPQSQGWLPLVTTECRWGVCSFQDFITTIQRTIRALLIFGYYVAATVSVIGAFMVMLGGYSQNWLNQGKKMMIDAITTYVILLLSGILFDLLLDLFKPKLYVP